MTRFITPYADTFKTQKNFFLPSMTQQQFKEESNINNIIDRYKATGYLTDPLNPSTRKPIYGDFSEIPSYQEVCNVIAAANEAFDALPAALRKRFNNDPQELLDFLNDEANTDEAIALGLVDKDEPVLTTIDVEPVIPQASQNKDGD
ncbi:internal scaffolding protein [Peromfec virus RodF8_61]|uniref:Internal scaffolding protein n=1 Tax=Peromfec virus RodF8_61 TaxID=2929387 RepID=A0A976N2L7_9VIRU|nr:internal scaffolding protein [Peromfec virus RodF8_61]